MQASLYSMAHTIGVVSSAMATSYPITPPEPGTPIKRACRIIAQDTDIDERVLRSLSEGAKRYSELKPVLDGRHDHNLTVALKRLQQEGLVRRRSGRGEGRDIHRYELSGLGHHTLLAIDEIRELGAGRATGQPSEDRTWHVTPVEGGGWRVVRAGAERASSRHERKTEAVDRARELARRRKGRLVLHYQDGRIQRHLSYVEA